VSAPLTLLESADLLGRYRYVELALFTALGRRSTSCDDPELAAFLSGASLAHGWRAREVEARLPVSVGLPGVAACTRSPSPDVDAAIARATAPGDDPAVLDALVGAVYPAMDAAYATRAAAASPAADPPILRLLARLRADLDTLRLEGAQLAPRLERPAAGRRSDVGTLLARAGVFGALRPDGAPRGAEGAGGART